MFQTSNQVDADCSKTRAALSEYHDNLLSARRIIEVEKHIAVCVECLQASREMETMITLLRSTPKRDSPDDFMMKLHNRLDALEPVAASPPLRVRLLDWLMSVGIALRIYRLHAVSFSLAGALMLSIFVMRPPHTMPKRVETSVEAENPSGLAMSLEQNAVNATEDPFSDPVANRLEVQTTLATGD